MRDIVILAGGRTDAETLAQTGCGLRCDLPFGESTVLERVLFAVEGLGRVIVVGGHEGQGDERIEAGGSFVESLGAAIGRVRSEDFLLVLSDLPFLTREALDRFLIDCPVEAAICYPIVPVAACEREFPGVKRTALRLRQGEFTGGNVCLMSQAGAKAIVPFLKEAYEARKSPLRLGRIVGVRVLLMLLWGRLVPGSLDIPKLERQVSRVLGCPIRAVQSPFAGLGTDVDTFDQYLALMALQSPGTVPTKSM